MPTTHITSMNCAVCVGVIYAAILKESIVFVYYHSVIDGFLSARWQNQLSYYGWEFDNLWVTAITGRHFSQLPEPLGHRWPQRNHTAGVSLSDLSSHAAAPLPCSSCSLSLPLPGRGCCSTSFWPNQQFHQVLFSPLPLPGAKRLIPA